MKQHTNAHIHWAALGLSLAIPYLGWSVALHDSNTQVTPGQIVILAGLWAFSIIACRVLLIGYSHLAANTEPNLMFRGVTNYILTACLLLQPMPYMWHAISESLGVSSTIYEMYTDNIWFVSTAVLALAFLTFAVHKLLRYVAQKIDQLHKNGYRAFVAFTSIATGLYAVRLAWGSGMMWLSLYLVVVFMAMCVCLYILWWSRQGGKIQ